MPAHRKLAAAALVLAIGLALALLFPAQRPPRGVAEPAGASGSSLAGQTESGSKDATTVASPVAEDIIRQALPGTSPSSTLPQSPYLAGDPPQATLTTVTAVQPDPRPALTDPPDLPEHYPRADPPTLRPIYPSVFDSGTGEDFEPGPLDERVHTVRDGDTLESLARLYLGSPARSWEIYELNRQLIVQEEVLPIGVDLRIPPLVAPAEPPRQDLSGPPIETRLPATTVRPPVNRRVGNGDPLIDSRPEDVEGLVPVRQVAPGGL